MEDGLTDVLLADPIALCVAVAADLAIGDPSYRLHPIRLMGRMLSSLEAGLRSLGADGYIGGIVLFLILGGFWTATVIAVMFLAVTITWWLAWLVHVFLLYSLLALGDLLRHVWRVESALSRGDLEAGRLAIADLVGRDVTKMDEAACRRAAIESSGENLTDGFTSPLFWYALTGLPGLVLFKVVSTMDSMVGFKTPRHLRFGWCGARLDDLMNYLPARLTWLLIAAVATVWPGCSGTKAFRVGLAQHAILPGPNSGWSEAATAGGIQRRLVGPIWMQGQLVTEIWIGDSADPPAGTREDVVRALRLVTSTGLIATAIAIGALTVSG